MYEIPNHVSLVAGNGGLPKLSIQTRWSTAEIYLHGAHVTHFQKHGEAPLLFMSAASEFTAGKPIRGGVPLIFPWFGPREGFPAHGFARTVEWELTASSVDPDGVVSVQLRLPSDDSLGVEFVIRVSDELSMDLVLTNRGGAVDTFETCMHTYFQIGSVHTVSVRGLAGTAYLDKLRHEKLIDSSDAIKITSEVERVYDDSAPVLEILDPTLNRKILVKKSGSKSTIVWNPWIAKSKAMPDFGDEEFHQMICVESGNVAADRTTLPSGESTTLHVGIASEPVS